jgi:glycosyltransferase involved in cell wall biosynthesis
VIHTILYPVNQLVIGGAEQQLLELVRGIDKDHFHPVVAPLYPGGGLEAEFQAADGVEIIPLNRRNKLDPSPLWKIHRILRHRKVDIVQPFLSPATFFGLMPALARESTLTVVTERCGVRRTRGLGYKTYRTVEDWMSQLADAIVPNSAAGQDMLLARGLPASRIHVIYNGINLDRLRVNTVAAAEHRAQMGASPTTRVIGMLASLTPAKGHATAIRAMAQLKDREPDICLAIVGDGPLRSELEQLTQELGIESQVHFFGYRRNVSDFLASFDVLVSASRDNEGCSNSILEAMALNVPVVATDIGGNRELVIEGETGWLVEPDNPSSLATMLARVLPDVGATAAVAERARNTVHAQFGLERMVQEYESLYQSLLRAGDALADADGRLVTFRTETAMQTQQ